MPWSIEFRTRWVNGSPNASTIDLSNSTSLPSISSSISLPICLDNSLVSLGNLWNTFARGCIRVCITFSCNSVVILSMFCSTPFNPGISFRCVSITRRSRFLPKTISLARLSRSFKRRTLTRTASLTRGACPPAFCIVFLGVCFGSSTAWLLSSLIFGVVPYSSARTL